MEAPREALDALLARRKELLLQEQEIQRRRGEVEAGIRLLANGDADDLLAKLPYSGMGVTKGVLEFLRTHPGRHTSKAIAAELRDGGVETEATNLAKLVDNLLRRYSAAENPRAQRFKDGRRAVFEGVRTALGDAGKEESATASSRGKR